MLVGSFVPTLNFNEDTMVGTETHCAEVQQAINQHADIGRDAARWKPEMFNAKSW